MSEAYATINDIESLWRPLTDAEKTRAESLLPVVSDNLRQEAINRGRNLDQMISDGEVLSGVVTSVTVDIVARVLMTATTGEPMTQESQSALGYSWSGTYLVPGGGLFIKNSELQRLGLKKQKMGVIEWYDSGNSD
jgi:hypothetical protein